MSALTLTGLAGPPGPGRTRRAEQAEAFATYLEKQAGMDDAEMRLSPAAVEHEIAAIARRNAAKLRGKDWPIELEHLPTRPVDEAPSE